MSGSTDWSSWDPMPFCGLRTFSIFTVVCSDIQLIADSLVIMIHAMPLRSKFSDYIETPVDLLSTTIASYYALEGSKHPSICLFACPSVRLSVLCNRGMELSHVVNIQSVPCLWSPYWPFVPPAKGNSGCGRVHMCRTVTRRLTW